MFEIKYHLTLEDQINSLEATKEYVSQLPILYWQNGYIIPLTLLFIDIPFIWQCLTNNFALSINSREVPIMNTVSNLVFAFLTLPQIQARLPIYTWAAKSQIKQSWLQNPEQIQPRKITVTDTEFIYIKSENYLFLEEDKKISYSWNKLRKYFECDRGFILEFEKQEQRYFIPKRILTDIEKLNKLREILNLSKA